MSTVVKDLGPVTAYAYAVAGGYTGTEEEFTELLGDLAATVADLESLTVTVTTLTPGSSATASYEDGVLALGIPQGAKGDTGTAATIAVGTVTTVAPTQNASVTNTGSSSAAVFAFSIPRGDGVATVTKTGTSGNVDTYTMTSDRGVTLGTFTVTNGNVSSVNGKTGAVVLDAGDLGYDGSETYSEGTVGAEISRLKSHISDIDNKVDTLANDVGGYIEKYADVQLETEVAHYINTRGVVVSGPGNYIVGEASVTAGEIYLITGSSNFNNPLWAWYDSEDNLISIGTKSEPGSTVTSVTDTEATAPTGATKIVINYITSGTACALKHYLGKKIAGKWYGKKWVCVGDSLTEVNNLTSKHYFDFVADETDISVVNMGVSGTGYARGQGDDNAFYQRILDCPADADVVTIFGSFNDLGAGLDVGTYTDTGTTTLAGCINTTIDNLQSVIPTVVLGIVAPTPWQSTQPTPLSAGDTYVNLLHDIAQHRSIPFLDLYRESNLRPWDSDFRELCYSNDGGAGTHPNELGHQIIAPKFEAFLDRLLLH